MENLFNFYYPFFTDLLKAKYDYISLETDQIIHYLFALVFVYKNWENNGIEILNREQRNKNEAIKKNKFNFNES